MDDKLRDLAQRDNIDISESFNIKFEETLNSLPDKKKTTNRIYQIVASLLVTILIGSGVAIAISNNKYKYVYTTGNVFDNDGKIYGLDETIEKEDSNGNKIILDMQIIEDRHSARVSVGGKYFVPKSEKAELKIGNKVYKNTRTGMDELEYSWGIYDVFEDIGKYDEGQEIVYSIYIDDINKIDFNVRLKEIEGVESYNNLGITSTYNNIKITAITNEKEDEMIVDFFVDDNSISVMPGKDGLDGTVPGIYLIDTNGKRVASSRKVENGSIKYNRVKFNTRNTQKPYKIVIPQVVADFFVLQDIDIYSNEITLDVPNDGEYIDINKEVKLDVKNVGIETDNDIVKLTTGKREGNKFIVNIEYPENETSEDYLRQVFALEERIISKDKQVFARSDFDENIKLINTLEFDVNMFKSKIKIKISPSRYDLKGNWEFIIE